MMRMVAILKTKVHEVHEEGFFHSAIKPPTSLLERKKNRVAEKVRLGKDKKKL